MASRDTLILRMRDPMDQWLESQGFFRKLIAKDGSCLFRAVSEQVFHTQVLHTKVRMACVNFMRRHKDLFDECGEGSLDEHISSMQNPWEWGGELEMRVMSFMYRCDFLLYRELGMPPVKATSNGFKNKILLCQLGNNQYDSVYPKEYVKGAAFCQSIVYHLLYDRVFKMEGTEYTVDKMLHDKTVRLRRDSCMTQCSTCTTVRKQNMNNVNDKVDNLYDGRIESHPLENKLSKEWYNNAKEILLQGIIPFPYKVAKALDSEIYRNIEFDVWNEQRKGLRWGVSDLLNGGESRELRVGSKCLVKLDSSPGKELHAHIQEMALEKGPVLVYVEELAKKCIVQFETLEPLPSAISSHSLLRPERGKHYWRSEKKHISNSCLQNTVNITNNNKHYEFQTWRHSTLGKNRINYGKYENKGSGGSSKEGSRSKNMGNKARGRGTSVQNMAVPVIAPQMPRGPCQPVTLNQEERFPQVLFTNPQLQINLQSQNPESSANVTPQVNSVLGPQSGAALTNIAKQPPLTSSFSTSSPLSESTVAPSVAPPCECPTCGEKAENQQCPLIQPVESERVPWNAQPVCYCCYPMMDWRAGPSGTNRPPPPYLSSCGGNPMPILPAPPIFPCPSIPPGMCMTPPDPITSEGRNMPYSEIPGYRIYNVGHDYYRPSYMAWPGSNICLGQQPDLEGGGAVPNQDEEKQPQQIIRTTIDVQHNQNECPPIITPVLPSASQQDSAFTGQIAQPDQDFTSHSEEEKGCFGQSMNQLKYTLPVPVQMTPEQATLMPERAREELPFASSQTSQSPLPEQESESISPHFGRWVDIVRHIPPPVNGSMVHSISSPYAPSQTMSSAMIPYPPTHGGVEPQFYICAATGPHPSGHHMLYSPFLPHHSMPHPQPHLLPTALHPRFIFPPANNNVPPSTPTHQ